MEIYDIKQARSINVELRVMQNIKIKENTAVKLSQQEDRTFIFPIDSNHPPFEVEAVDNKNHEKLTNVLKRNLPRLSQLIMKSDENTITVAVKIFADERPMDLSIGIEDDFIDKEKRKVKIKQIRRPEIGLADMFLISSNQTQYAVIGMHVRANEKNRFENFLLAGKEGYLQIKRKTDEDDNDYFMTDKILTRVNKEDYAFYLVKGKFEFKNATFMEKARLETIACMNDLGGTIESYLNTWEEYGKLEIADSFQKLRGAGMFKFTDCHYTPNGQVCLVIHDDKALEQFAESVQKGDWVALSSVNPSDLFSDNVSIDRYDIFSKTNKVKTLELADNISPQSMRILIKPPKDDVELEEEGYIFLSLSGDIERFKRREQSRDNILSAQSQMPHLAAIMEGKSVSRPQRNHYEPITETVREKVFPKHPPTPKQKEAIEMALNTPDIALIQGPPGTGKTTVILGILERLNEIYDSSDGVFGKNLVSAFQHDAVQNATDRIQILGLPAIKFGKKSSDSSDNIQVIEHTVENWISDKIQQLYKTYPEIVKEKYFEEYNKIYTNYLYSANTIENTIMLLKETKNLLVTRLSVDLLNEIEETISGLKYSLGKKKDPRREQVIKSVSKIPYSLIAFEDNGMETIMEAIYRLKIEDDKKFGDEIAQLNSILSTKQIEQKHVDKLKAIRKRLLITLLPKENIFNSRMQKEEIIQLFNKISANLEKEFYKTKSGEEAALLDYINEYENSPLSIRQAILEYISVLGATNQQALGKDIKEVKGENNGYDNVLIDEAARSNPLDLFIPMSLAKDRIILVGDHRQLPHIVDENIVKDIENNYQNEEESILEKINKNLTESMFEHLFQKLKILERKDGIPRTITLDKQYRTHPVLGDFISKNFYQKHGETYIGSGLPSEVFTHRLKGLEDKVCVWLDIPLSKERERSGSSKSRPIEARKIAEHLKIMIDSDEGKGLTFGIITFYKKQVETIWEELVKVDIATINDEGKYELLSQYREEEVNGKKVEKLRIGTVDAFQGMEFDVVYLSMVRSNDLPDRTQKEKQLKYGFLMVENRLCVSMSRQKKMLIVVGDSNMLQTPGAEDAIEALVNYYKLCLGDEKYGKII